MVRKSGAGAACPGRAAAAFAHSARRLGVMLIGGGVGAACGMALMAARASTVQSVEMTCPYDGTPFTATLQGSGTQFGKTLDYRPYGAIIAPLPLAVCPTNGFVFYRRDFKPDELERMRPFVLSDAYQALKGETPHYRAAWLKQRAGEPALSVTWTLLEASWEAPAGSDQYRRYAGEVLARLPADIAALVDDKKAPFRLLQGELLRRLGRFDEAGAVFAALKAEGAAQGNEVRVADFQLGLVARRDAGSYRMIDALGTDAPGTPKP